MSEAFIVIDEVDGVRHDAVEPHASEFRLQYVASDAVLRCFRHLVLRRHGKPYIISWGWSVLGLRKIAVQERVFDDYS